MRDLEVGHAIPFHQAVLCKNDHIHASSYRKCPACYTENGTMLSRIIGPHGRLLDGSSLTAFQLGTLSCKTIQPVLDWYVGGSETKVGTGGNR